MASFLVFLAYLACHVLARLALWLPRLTSLLSAFRNPKKQTIRYGNLEKWQKSSRAAPTRLTAGFVVNGRLLSTVRTGVTQKEQRNSKLAARQDAVKASRVSAAEERVSL